MEISLKSMMDKLQSNDGFTMIEMLFVLMILSICILITPVISKQQKALLHFDMERIREICMNAQAEAIKSHQKISVKISDNYVIIYDLTYQLHPSTSCSLLQFHFTAQGTISKGFTLKCKNKDASSVLVAQIGSGRFDVR